jgi:uncharacterized protein YecE (DUF72 family)
MRVHVGTSGYNYPEWRGSFYPEGQPAKGMFAFYASRFRTVEINYTFYRMPTAKTTAAWQAQAPDGFKYALKAPQQITHVRRLKDVGDTVGLFGERARELGSHLGPLLFQLPPNFRCDPARLETFLAGLPTDLRAAMEFRHDSWFTEDVMAILSARGVALCLADMGGRAAPDWATARHGYLRLRDEGYTTADLGRWADRVAAHAADWDEAFVYFKHEEQGKGPEFARMFSAMIEARGFSQR